MITVDFEVDDWVWLCEFLSEVLKEGDLDPYEQDDTQRLLNLLRNAEKGQAKGNLTH